MTDVSAKTAAMNFLHLGLACVLAALPAAAADRAFTNADGTLRIVPRPVDPKFNNPWPPAWEKSFQARAAHTVRHFATNRLGGTSYGESEKDSAWSDPPRRVHTMTLHEISWKVGLNTRQGLDQCVDRHRNAWRANHLGVLPRTARIPSPCRRLGQGLWALRT